MIGVIEGLLRRGGGVIERRRGADKLGGGGHGHGVGGLVELAADEIEAAQVDSEAHHAKQHGHHDDREL